MPLSLWPLQVDGRRLGGTICGYLARGKRNEHRYLLAITAVLIAEHLYHIALLQIDAEEDIAGGSHREQKMPHRHGRRRPEGEQKAKIERVPHALVEKGR